MKETYQLRALNMMQFTDIVDNERDCCIGANAGCDDKCVDIGRDGVLRLVPTGETVMKQWWNSDETVVKQWWNSDETGWIRAMKQWWNTLNLDESAMKQFVSWSWNTLKHVQSRWIINETICFMVVKHRETCWIRMKHGHETPWIKMKQCFLVMKYLESGWNSVFHGHETHCFMPMKHLESRTVTTEISIFLYWFLIHCVSWCFTALFHAVIFLFHCCFMLFHCCFMLFHCCFMLFHGVSMLCFILFQGVSLPCFILFLDHETGAVGTSLETALTATTAPVSVWTAAARWALFGTATSIPTQSAVEVATAAKAPTATPMHALTSPN